jgi:hypothetical protein
MNMSRQKSASDPDMSICLSEESASPVGNITFRHPKPTHKRNTIESKNQMETFQMEMRKLMTYFISSQKEELQQLNTTMKEIQEINKGTEFSIAKLTKQNEEFLKRIDKLEESVKEDREYILFLEDKLEELQLGNRKTNFEIKGVPKKESETKQNLVEIVIALSESIDYKISKSDINDIYRIRSKRPEHKNTPIVVELGSTLQRNDLLKMAKTFNIRHKTKLCAKHLGYKTQEDTPIFLSENLTFKGSRLHFLARDLARSKGYKYVWTSYGKVYVRRNEQSQIILIKNEQQVHNLLLQQD